ncbi:Molybdopterin biosynthesis protein MoeA [Candidatus Rhodobacter oscarellae]|uniref:Molybdopterin biosynthesis protein MoeA n=1 Tax=Candidatus Rhodobacter oscarellae TaxID=1675527 RepID=A0A0J9E1S1_9RHOB|nr:Molybdopterin biosynthesis protein MoeA [Candidatus Rhodobacter lobularis]
MAHSAEAGPQGQGHRIAKGTRLTRQHVIELSARGVAEVVVARPEPGDVEEDMAAQRLAQALVAGRRGLRLGGAARGRVNLRAEHAGLVEMDVAAVTAANHIDPGITVATVPALQRMAENGLVATIKIIPYAVPDAGLRLACDKAAGAMGLRGAQIAAASLIETQVGSKALPLKGREAIAQRLARLGAQLSPRVVVPHQVAPIADALAQAPGEVLMILTGSATSDPRDVAPEALRAAGGVVEHYGMPVDPGNLLFLGHLGGKPVIGLPGCARSLAMNGADWVLERVICGIEVSPRDIMGMGVGGLLKESPARGQPRERKTVKGAP